MYIVPAIGADSHLAGVGLKERGFECLVPKGSGDTRSLLEGLAERVRGRRTFVIFSIGDLARLNGIGLRNGVDISAISRGEVIAVSQCIHAIAWTQSVAWGQSTPRSLCELLGYGKAGGLAHHPSELVSLRGNELRMQLAKECDALEFIHRRLKGYIEAGRRVRGCRVWG